MNENEPQIQLPSKLERSAPVWIEGLGLLDTEVAATELLACLLLGYGSLHGTRLVATRHQIARYGHISFRINAKDHNPPHFHVRIDASDVSYRIDTGEVLKGDLERRTRHVVRTFHAACRPLLMDLWEKSRVDATELYRESEMARIQSKFDIAYRESGEVR